jgi:2-hydroxycyclohexanecarboxyl-CoA dehydrogenase
VTPRRASRVALITGGGGGIGEATARLFAEEGSALALVDSDKAAVEAAAAGISRDVPGARVSAVAADVSSEAQAQRAVDEALGAFGRLDTVANVAGVRLYIPLAEADSKGWEHILGVNVLATAYCCKAALPALRRGGRGTIVNVSSLYGVKGRAGMGQYDTTKAAVLGFTRALAVEEAPHGIRVNAVCPGGTITSAPPPRKACPSPTCAPSGRGTICSVAGRSRARSPTPFSSWPATSRPTSPGPR